MHRPMIQRLALAFSIFLLSVAPASHAQTVSPTTTSLAGIGDSNARPTGAWPLPDGVVFSRPITGYSVFAPESCAPPDHPEKGAEAAQAAGTLVQLCLPLRHTRQRNGEPYDLPIRVDIPPGVIFISDDLSTQNGIVIQRFIVEVRPGETIYVPIILMCLNDGRSASHPAATYRIGPLLENAAFDALFQRLEGKRITEEGAPYVQAAVWALSEGETIPPQINDQLGSLPDA